MRAPLNWWTAPWPGCDASPSPWRSLIGSSGDVSSVRRHSYISIIARAAKREEKLQIGWDFAVRCGLRMGTNSERECKWSDYICIARHCRGDDDPKIYAASHPSSCCTHRSDFGLRAPHSASHESAASPITLSRRQAAKKMCTQISSTSGRNLVSRGEIWPTETCDILSAASGMTD